MSPKKKTTTILIIIIIAAAVIFLGWLLFGRKGPSSEEAINPEVSVEVGQVIKTTLHRYVSAYGQVEPEPPGESQKGALALISSPVGGVLTEALVREGQLVKEGQLLFRFDTRMARIAVLKAQKELELARDTYERQKQLLSGEATSIRDFRAAEAALHQAEGNLASAETDLSYLELKSPISGYLTRIEVSLGQNVEPNRPLAEVVDLNRLVVTARVPSEEAAWLRPGQEAELSPAVALASGSSTGAMTGGNDAETKGSGSVNKGATSPASDGGPGGDGNASHSQSVIPDVPGASTLSTSGAIKARVTFVSRDIDPQTDTVLVRVAVPAGSGLTPGKFLSLKIVAAVHENCLAVPVESLVRLEGKEVISIVENGVATQHPVVSGFRDGGLVEVSGEGLKEGQTVVTVGAYALPEKVKVRILNRQN
ncbi:MAG TPA: efflux RND transporter periplasmic adaptor subunit [Candidatus Saccharicenans sp.]|jgi:membrane fusion protein (multidrug efflux system)|nr:efflux RND transporter periplasmic adaptor subunit [Candidatus Saccharicenans sp.]